MTTPPAYGYPVPPTTPAAPARVGNPPGVAAVVLGGVLLVSMVVQMVLQTLVVASGNYDALGIVSTVTAVIDAILGIVAVVCGVIGIARRGRPHALAGIGLAAVVNALVWGLIYPLTFSFM